jgi:hypothetical protein
VRGFSRLIRPQAPERMNWCTLKMRWAGVEVNRRILQRLPSACPMRITAGCWITGADSGVSHQSGSRHSFVSLFFSSESVVGHQPRWHHVKPAFGGQKTHGRTLEVKSEPYGCREPLSACIGLHSLARPTVDRPTRDAISRSGRQAAASVQCFARLCPKTSSTTEEHLWKAACRSL